MNFRKLFIAILFVTMMVCTAFAQSNIVTVSESDWQQDGSDLYVYQNGEMLKDSWVFFDHEWYFVKSDGKVAVNEWVSNLTRTYFAGENGKMMRNCTETINGKEYNFNSLGASDPAASDDEISVWDKKAVKEVKPTKAAEAVDDEELEATETVSEESVETKDTEVAESINNDSDNDDAEEDEENNENYDIDENDDTEVAEDVDDDEDDAVDNNESDNTEIAEEATKEETQNTSSVSVGTDLISSANSVTLNKVDKEEEKTNQADEAKAETKTVKAENTTKSDKEKASEQKTTVTKGKTYNVLMIGNSKTYFNNMPTMFEKLVNTAYKNGKCDFKVNVEQFAFSGAAKGYNTGGMTLIEIYNKHTDKVKAKLQEKKWDFLILQPGSTQVFKTADITKSINTYYSLAKKKNPDLKVILYIMNLSEKYNINKYATIVKNAEKAVKNSNVPSKNIRLAYVASAFKACHDKQKTWTKVIRSDKNHPTIEGSYMITCVFYAVMTGKSPVGLKYQGKIAKSDVSLSASDFSGKNGTKYCTSSTHKAASNYEYYQKMAWEIEKDKSKY